MEEKHSHKPLPPPAPMQTQPWMDEFSGQLLRVFPASEFSEYLGQQFAVVDSSDLAAIIRHLKTEGFDFLVDLTSVDYPQREKRFELVYELYSFARNRRVRVKARFADGEAAPSITAIHPGANWLEREVFDMFGIRFDGHPDLRRMLLPEDWQGHPLRKDSSILGVDQDWVKANLGIEQ